MSSHPFAKKKEARFMQEAAQKIFLRLATYAILFFTLFVFWEIIAKGAPVLKQYGWDFVKRKPETLEVVSFDAGKNLQIPQESFKTLQTYNPDETLFTEVKEISRAFEYVDFKIQPKSFISDGYLSQIEKHNQDFRAEYKSRSLTSPVAFTTVEEQSIIVSTELYSKLKGIPVVAALPVNVLELENKLYPVTFQEKECQMQAKTIVALSSSDLIYKLYGNLTDTADDNPTELMKLYLPRTQTVHLTPAQYAAYDSDTGTAKFGEVEAVITKTQKVNLSLPAGQYELPFNLFREVSTKALSFDAQHQHNLDRGVIELDLKKATSTLRLPKAEFETMKKDNPAMVISEVSPVQEKQPYTQFNLSRASEIKLPTTDMSAFRIANKGVKDSNGQLLLNVLNEHVYPYSGGGISGPILGTALLVIACMMIGLIIGVSAAVFLGEYSKKGKLIYLIRLSMMNLAGVPSIVFGIFGLGLFVSLAPLITDTPSINDKVKIKLLPSFTKPDLRTQERQRIKMVEKGSNLTTTLRVAQQEGLERYFTGWTYLSFQGWGNSIIAGAFTLAIMVLPIIITSTEESLRAVPRGFREASLALGASKWQSIKTAVLPYATPGILTASVLGITRVAGETAPIMFTAAVAAKSDLPFNGLQGSGFQKFLEFISQSVQAMPYHIYTISGRLPPSYHIKPMQYGSVLVFMIIVMIFAGLSVWLRGRMRKKYKW